MKFFLTILLTIIVASAQTAVDGASSIARPVETPDGIVFTNALSNSLYRSNGGEVDELFSSAGCGMYYTLSPDRRTIGFKYIGPDGLQAPALLDIATKQVTLLHDPVPQAGQVSFALDGSVAYSIGTDVVIRNGTTVQTIPVGVYSNIVALSPDGRSFAYNNDVNQLFIRNIADGTTSQITGAGAGYFRPLWSPAGDALCYSRLDGSVFVHTLRNGTTVALGEGFDPVWTTDGRSLVVERRETDKQELINSDLYLIAADGSSSIRLTETVGRFEAEPSIGLDGTIVYRMHSGNDVFRKAAGASSERIGTIPVELPRTERILVPPSLKKNSSDISYFEMPYTNQVYDTPDWYNGHSACGPTSSIMVIAYYGLLPSWNVWCAYSSPAHWSAYGRYVCEKYHFKGIDYALTASDPNGKDSWGGYGYMWSVGSPYSRMSGYYNYHGLTTTRQDSPPISFVTDETANGHPYTLCNGLTTAGHIIVINGIGAEAHTLIANDPYGNKNSGKYPSRDGRGIHYDWPGYNNGFQNLNTVYWGITVRYTPPAHGDSVVDDLQFAGGFSMSNAAPSSMFAWKDMPKGFNGHFWYVKTKTSDTCYAVWSPTLHQDGMYEVSAYIPYSNATAAVYRVKHRDGTTNVTVDQKQYANEWVPLGTFAMMKDSVNNVRLGDGSDSVGQEIIFDAVQFKYVSALSVARRSSVVPDRLGLSQNYPNPFNPATEIRFSIPASEAVSLKVYSLLGAEVAELVHETMEPGEYAVPFNAAGLSSGVYLYTLRAGNAAVSKRMLLLK